MHGFVLNTQLAFSERYILMNAPHRDDSWILRLGRTGCICAGMLAAAAAQAEGLVDSVVRRFAQSDFEFMRAQSNAPFLPRTAQPMVDSIGKRCNDAAARSRRNPCGTGLGELRPALRGLVVSTYRPRLAPNYRAPRN